MAAEPAERELAVPPEIVPELREALVASLHSVVVAVGDLETETDRDRRADGYRTLVDEFSTRYELQEVAGWPEDPRVEHDVLIRGGRLCDFTLRCLTRHRDSQLQVAQFQQFGDEPPPATSSSVRWPDLADRPRLPDRLTALEGFLRAAGQDGGKG